MKQLINDKRGFFMILELLLTLVIVLVLCYIAINTYFKKPPVSQEMNQFSQEPEARGLDTSSPLTFKESAKKTLDDINKQHQAQTDNLIEQGVE